MVTPYRHIVAASILASMLGGCGHSPIEPQPPVDADGDAIADAADACPAQPETRNGVFDADGCPDTPLDLYEAARRDVEGFFQVYFQAVLFRPYYGLSRMTVFRGQTFSACGVVGSPSYCGLDLTVYLESAFMEDQLRRIGDFAPAAIVAHEVGHHTQYLLGITGTVPSIQLELQADCLAGAWAASAGARGLLDPGDFQEAAQTLFEVGDPAGVPWFAPGAHGSPLQRQQAFVRGYSLGLAGC